jgi:hypothetical protein
MLSCQPDTEASRTDRTWSTPDTPTRFPPGVIGCQKMMWPRWMRNVSHPPGLTGRVGPVRTTEPPPETRLWSHHGD